MRVPVPWLRELVDLPTDVPTEEVAARLTAAGLKVEAVHRASAVGGPLVVGRVVAYEDETHPNGKTIRWCTVDVGEPEPRGIVCGAFNFAVGDAVVVALPGAVLPGGIAIGARRTYGHLSDGMICSPDELGLGADHSSILVLPGEHTPGADADAVLGLRDEVLEIAVTPDRGYALAMRGVAREAATAFGVSFRDPATVPAPPAAADDGYSVRVDDAAGCPLFVARTVHDVDATRPPPLWLQRRLRQAGMRPISLVVDITNYVMLELGQPIHGYDADRLHGPIVVRRARPGEWVETLDGKHRALDPEDLLITDDSGPIGIAGVMGGASTEVSPATTSVVVEAAHFAPVVVGRAARRHRLPSEASRRFERGVDPALPPAAAQRVVDLLVELGGARAEPTITVVGQVPARRTVRAAGDLATRTLAVPVPAERFAALLTAVGCEVTRTGAATDTADTAVILEAAVPTWRPDLRDPADLVEEAARLIGYDAIGSVLPVAPPGRGWTAGQRARRRVGTALAEAGFVEAPSYPFVGLAELDSLGLPADDPRRVALRLANPLSEEQPYLRTTLLPGLLTALRRNVSRGASDVALFEDGLVFRPQAAVLPPAPRLPVEGPPTPEQLAALEAALPAQPRRVAAVLCGDRDPAGWWGPGRAASWADAIEAARLVAAAAGVALDARADQHAPWHPGRCAQLLVDGRVVGHAGELHPRVVAALGLPSRTCAMELELDRVPLPETPVRAPAVSPYPPAAQDVALVVPLEVPAADVEAALHAGAGPLLEHVGLFDVYTGDQVPQGHRSLAYTLRLRAPDRTLTVEEVSAAREAAVAEAHRRTGAVLRGT